MLDLTGVSAVRLDSLDLWEPVRMDVSAADNDALSDRYAVALKDTFSDNSLLGGIHLIVLDVDTALEALDAIGSIYLGADDVEGTACFIGGTGDRSIDGGVNYVHGGIESYCDQCAVFCGKSSGAGYGS